MKAQMLTRSYSIRNGLLNLATNDATYKFLSVGLAVLVAVMKRR